MITKSFFPSLLLFVVVSNNNRLVESAFGNLLWNEEFDGYDGLNPSFWNYDIGTGSNGWGNLELQTYTDSIDNVQVKDGILTITAFWDIPRRVGGQLPPDCCSITSGRINTNKKFAFQYGTLETRVKLSNLSNGAWPAFWTLGNNYNEIGWPKCGEIDIMEMGNSASITEGLVNSKISSATHWENDGSLASYSGRGPYYDDKLNLAGSERWIDLKMEWDPQFIRTYVNNNMHFVIDISNGANADLEEFHKPHFILANLAIGGRFTGILNKNLITTPFPATYQIDYIRLYDNGHTILVHDSDGTSIGSDSSRHSESDNGSNGGGLEG